MEKHYEDLKEKKFFPGLINYMTSGPVFAMGKPFDERTFADTLPRSFTCLRLTAVWEGKDAILGMQLGASLLISYRSFNVLFVAQAAAACWAPRAPPRAPPAPSAPTTPLVRYATRRHCLAAIPLTYALRADVGRNIIHGSDGPAGAEAEIKLWFPEGVVEYKAANYEWVYE